MSGHNFKELKTWKQSRSLATEVYRVSANFPPEEKFGLTSQIRRAAVSAPSNIAEDSGRNTNTDFAQFLSMSIGSVNEVITLLYLATDFEYIKEQILNYLTEKYDELNRMISAFRNKLITLA